MSDSQTAPISEQNSSSSEDFEFIEKEENGAFGLKAKETARDTPEEITDTQIALDSNPTEIITSSKESENNNLVDLETSHSPTNPIETESLVIIDRNEPEIIPKENTEDILPKIEPPASSEIPILAANTGSGLVDKDDAEVREIFSQNLLDSPTTKDEITGIEQRQDESDISVPEKQNEQLETHEAITETEAKLSNQTDNLEENVMSNSPNITFVDNPIEDAVIYTDRTNSPDPQDPSLSYTYDVEREYWEIEDADDPQASNVRWKRIYMQLHMHSMENPPSQRIARMQQNRPLNRYSNILANDATRIVLTHPDTEYINANFITVPEVDRKYIMTQGPLDITSEHFWHMIWQEDCPGIVMLNRTFESGKLKCYQYFPKDAGQQLVFGNFLIVCQSQYDTDCYRMSNLELTHLPTQELRCITHFQYLSWPDFGAPQTPEDFLQFLTAVREKGILSMEVGGPPVIHCSAGVGRSGTFILVDACLRRIEIEGHPLNVHVQDLILRMREQRFGCIQSDEQLKFSYVAILVATHNIMSDLPIAIVPELVERARQEVSLSPVPPKRTTSRITKSEHEITPTQFMEKSTVVLSQPVESPPETNLNDTEPQGTIRERIRAEILPELLQPRIEEIIIENESKISPLKITLAVIFLSIGIGVFYLLFF